MREKGEGKPETECITPKSQVTHLCFVCLNKYSSIEYLHVHLIDVMLVVTGTYMVGSP